MQHTLMKDKIFRARVTQADLPISLNGAAERPAMAGDKLQEATSHRGAESAAATAGDEGGFPRQRAFFTPISSRLEVVATKLNCVRGGSTRLLRSARNDRAGANPQAGFVAWPQSGMKFKTAKLP
jgi:hypothetical protein